MYTSNRISLTRPKNWTKTLKLGDSVIFESYEKDRPKNGRVYKYHVCTISELFPAGFYATVDSQPNRIPFYANHPNGIDRFWNTFTQSNAFPATQENLALVEKETLKMNQELHLLNIRSLIQETLETANAETLNSVLDLLKLETPEFPNYD